MDNLPDLIHELCCCFAHLHANDASIDEPDHKLDYYYFIRFHFVRIREYYFGIKDIMNFVLTTQLNNFYENDDYKVACILFKHQDRLNILNKFFSINCLAIQHNLQNEADLRGVKIFIPILIVYN